MLSPATQNKTRNAALAGKKSGMRVICNDEEILEKYNALADSARNGNYWAQQITSGILGLTSGRLHMNNVFVRKGAGTIYGRGAFYVVLPGATATIEQLDNSEFVLTELNADSNFQKLQKKKSKPGLWKVTREEDSWTIKHISDSQNTPMTENQYVAISDQKADIEDATDSAVEGFKAINSTTARQIENSGFILHYTLGGEPIGGLKNCKQAMTPDTSKKLHESAILLAQTMHQSKDVGNVQWMSDWGGSGVLTQSLRILADSNVKLSKHAIYLNHPTTRPSKAMEYGFKVGLKGNAIEKKSGVMPSEMIGNMFWLDTPVSNLTRAKHDKNYSSTNIAGNAASTTSKVVGTGLGVTGALGAFGVVALAAPVSAAMGVAGGVLLTAGLLNKAVRTVAPKTHKKISSNWK